MTATPTGPRIRWRGSTQTRRSSTRRAEGASSTTPCWSPSAPGRSSPTSTSAPSATPTLTPLTTASCRTSRAATPAALAFIQPVGPVWPLPLYELALMTAERAESMDIRDLELVLVTPEPRPLAVFGTAVSDVVTNRLARAGHQGLLQLAREGACRTAARHPAAGRRATPDRDHHDAAHRRAFRPRPARRRRPRLPTDRQALLGPRHGRTVFAAGDAANYPIKHGGLGAQMADAAAAAIAVLAGPRRRRPRSTP